MNRWTKRISVGLASAAMAGGALLGAGGTASAAVSQPAQHTVSPVSAVRTDGGWSGYHDDGHGIGWNGRHDDGRGINWDGRHQWSEHRDGRHVYIGYGNRWSEVTPWRGVATNSWYADQLVSYLNHR
ncbi:hypothetical protein ACWD5R_30115 [Streptomyces sp. NPDC002514]|uniref:hypothetical protein n=1 Tax=unclassified Streptomyces TaxID=2593676 RepID=UPI0036A2AFFC